MSVPPDGGGVSGEVVGDEYFGHDALVRVIAFGRLSLFGAGATRLHDQLISIGARWVEGKKDPLDCVVEVTPKDRRERVAALKR